MLSTYEEYLPMPGSLTLEQMAALLAVAANYFLKHFSSGFSL
jgi:hypothetical protein